MRLIEGPTHLQYPPRACVVSNRIDGDFIDFQKSVDALRPTHLYVRRSVVEEAAELCGMVPRSEVEEVRETLKAVSERLDEMKEQMQTYAEFEERFRPREEMTPA
jgi:predicted translin family RNA/ssDNA-binding protein